MLLRLVACAHNVHQSATWTAVDVFPNDMSRHVDSSGSARSTRSVLTGWQSVRQPIVVMVVCRIHGSERRNQWVLHCVALRSLKQSLSRC